MRKLALLFLVCSFFTACKTKQVTNGGNFVESIVNPYFSNVEVDYIYQAKIKAFSKDFSGIFIVKKISSNAHRVVLTSDFGNTLVDLTLSENDYKVNYILDDLNKKILIKTLVNDFRILLQTEIVAFSKEKIEGQLVYSSGSPSKILKYSYNFINKSLSSISLYKKSKEIVIFDFSEVHENICLNITIEHKNWPITIQLTKQ